MTAVLRLLFGSGATLLVAAALMVACGADPLTVPEPPRVSPQHDDADVAFARAMIPHHAEGAEMARLAADRAGGDDVTRLADRIRQDQETEVAGLYGLLRAWDAADTGPTDPGETTGEQMEQLEELRGAAFDRQFLTLMTLHHERAVALATTELAEGASPEARILAGRVLDVQQVEIGEMQAMLDAR